MHYIDKKPDCVGHLIGKGTSRLQIGDVQVGNIYEIYIHANLTDKTSTFIVHTSFIRLIFMYLRNVYLNFCNDYKTQLFICTA